MRIASIGIKTHTKKSDLQYFKLFRFNAVRVAGIDAGIVYFGQGQLYRGNLRVLAESFAEHEHRVLTRRVTRFVWRYN